MTNPNSNWDDEFEPSEATWLTLQDAVDLLSRSSDRGYVSAKENLFALISDGHLNMKSEATCEDCDAGEFEWTYGSTRFRKGLKHKVVVTLPERHLNGSFTRRVSSPKPLRSDYWLKAKGWAIDTDRTDFSLGLIVGTKQPTATKKSTVDALKSVKRRAALGVLVERTSRYFPGALEAQAGRAATDGQLQVEYIESNCKPNAPMIRQTRRGRNKSDLWSIWFAEVLTYAKVHGIDTSMTACDFNQLINERIYERNPQQECLDLSTVEKTIGAIMARWTEERTNGRIP